MAHAAWSVIFHKRSKAYSPNSLLDSSTLNAYKNAGFALTKNNKNKITIGRISDIRN